MSRNRNKYWENDVREIRWDSFKRFIESKVANGQYCDNMLINNQRLLMEKIDHLNEFLTKGILTEDFHKIRIKVEDLNDLLIKHRHEKTGEVVISKNISLKKHGSGFWKVLIGFVVN